MESKREIDKELKFYNTNEVGEILGLTSKTVTRYIQSGKIKAQKIGRKWVIRDADLKEFLNLK